jgi:hypothetical protein
VRCATGCPHDRREMAALFVESLCRSPFIVMAGLVSAISVV